jgi:hypothetical protein
VLYKEPAKRPTRAIDDELAAFVAAALFNINSAPSPTGPFPFNTTTQPYAAAHQVALNIANNKGYAISPIIANPLRQAILSHPTYAHIHANPKITYSNNGLIL